MSKLPALKSRDIIRALEKAGFVEHRQKGGHKIFKKDNLRVTVPVHPRDLKEETVHSIIEQTGLTVEEFIALLKK
jgi:predicted RNA binding protein YcfA (HicA-like mRNA interferase family)